jgi:threonine dehydrogenase-like Zn-dependent dehydrogenase
MRALAVNSKGVQVVERPDPEPEPNGVVVAVQACGICGSDVHMAGSSHLDGFVPGHEFSGTISALGDEVSDFAIGDHVAVDPLGSCGHCEACAKGLPFLCQAIPNIGVSRQGAFAERIAVPARQLHRLSNEVELELGSHAEPLAVSLASIDRAEVEPDSDVLVVGVGTIGLMAIAGLRRRGVGRIVAVGRSPGRREAAALMGADIVIDAREGDLSEQLRSLGLRFAAAIECSGAPDMVLRIAPVMGIGGTIVEVALPAEPGPVDLRELVSLGLSVTGSCAFAPEHYAHALELLATGDLDPSPLVSERVGLDEAPSAFERLRTPGTLVGVLVEPWR